MADGCAAGRTGETAVGDERNRGIQLHAGQRGGRVEHLAHTRTALRAFVADDNNVTRHDLAVVNGGNCVFLAVEHACRTFVHHHFRCNCRTLDNTAVLCDVAPQNSDAAGLRIRILERTNDLGVLVDNALKVLADRLTGAGDERQVEEIALGQLLHDGRNAACHIKLLNVVRACRCEVTDIRHLAGQFVQGLKLERYARLVGDSQQVQNRVGRAADRHLAGQRVAECCRREDVARLDVLLDQLHDLHAGVLCQMNTGSRNRRGRAVARQRHADRFGQAVHRVCGVHACARAAARAGIALGFVEGRLVHHAGLVSADRLEGFGQGYLLTAEMACEHRAAGNQNGRNVQTSGSHQHAGHDLVAVRDEHQTIQLVRLCQRLYTVRDQLTACQRILHADVTHGNAVAYADGRNEHRRTACHANACLNRIRDLIEVDMARDDLGICRNHTDDRLLHFLVGHTAGTQQRTVRHALGSCSDVITSSHGDFPPLKAVQQTA